MRPGKAGPAREAHAVYFIDRALATFFSAWAQEFRSGLEQFQAGFGAANAVDGSVGAAGSVRAFANSDSAQQIAFLKTVDGTPFFDTVRTLTLLGMFSSPKYGGNYQGSGWKMMGFADQHAFTPPFGHYDREYTGFVPYPEKHS